MGDQERQTHGQGQEHRTLQNVLPDRRRDRVVDHRSHFGISYISLFVSDMDSTLARLQEAGVEPLAKVTLPLEIAIGAILRPPEEWEDRVAEPESELPEAVHTIVVKDPDGNFIEPVDP